MRMEDPFALCSIALENVKARQSAPRGGSCCRARQLFMLGLPQSSREGIQIRIRRFFFVASFFTSIYFYLVCGKLERLRLLCPVRRRVSPLPRPGVAKGRTTKEESVACRASCPTFSTTSNTPSVEWRGAWTPASWGKSKWSVGCTNRTCCAVLSVLCSFVGVGGALCCACVG